MKLSVIIPNLNSPTIDLTLQALRNQSYQAENFEVFIVGMDEFNLIVESDNIHFLRSHFPLSPASARNQGAREAQGDILIFLDADCIPSSDWLKKIIFQFKDSNVHILGGGVQFTHENYWTLSDNISMFYEYLSVAPPGSRKQLPSLNLAMRKSVFDTVGGFDERYPKPSGEDADLTIRIKELGHTLWFFPGLSVTHAPPRNNLKSLLRHGFYQGMYSTKVDPRYNKPEGIARILWSRAGLIIFSPIIAAATTVRIQLKPYLRKYWYTAPAIYLSKIAWCFGASRHPEWS